MPRVPGAVRTPVLIVGGGPVGLYASALLSRFGVPSLLVERFTRGLRHPRAHLINTRTMELLQELGVERRVRALAPPQAEWRSFRYCTTLLGEQIAVEDHLVAQQASNRSARWTAGEASAATAPLAVWRQLRGREHGLVPLIAALLRSRRRAATPPLTRSLMPSCRPNVHCLFRCVFRCVFCCV